MKRLLDLFCGGGGCTKGYQLAGFWVRGVDLKSQPRYIGEEFIQADALEYLRDLIESGEIAEFDAIHASPPCQFASECTPPQHRAKHKNLIPQTRELLRLAGMPYVIENVENARFHLDDPLMLCGSMFGLKVWRHRYFEIKPPIFALLPPCNHAGYPVLITGTTRRAERNGGRFEYSAQECREASGLHWMTRTEMDQAIPPAYTEYIGKELLHAIRRSPYGAAGTAEGKRQPSPVSTPAASPKAALHAFAAEGGGSSAAPTGRASFEAAHNEQ